MDGLLWKGSCGWALADGLSRTVFDEGALTDGLSRRASLNSTATGYDVMVWHLHLHVGGGGGLDSSRKWNSTCTMGGEGGDKPHASELAKIK